MDVVAEDGQDERERVLDLAVMDVQAINDRCGVEAFAPDPYRLLAKRLGRNLVAVVLFHELALLDFEVGE